MAMEVAATVNSSHLMPYQVFELTFQHANQYVDPTWDVTIDVTFTSPSGKTSTVDGFFYGSSKKSEPEITEGKNKKKNVVQRTGLWKADPADLWKARFAPSEIGKWTYTWTFKSPKGETAEGKGAIEVVKGRVPQHGFVRLDPDNKFRMRFDDGTPFVAVGFQTGVGHPPGASSCFDSMGLEGPFRLGRDDPLPPGPMFVRGPNMGKTSADDFFGRMSRAGFNFWRFSPYNAGNLDLFSSPDDAGVPSRTNVRWEEGIMVDEMLQYCRKYDIRVMYGLFGYMDVCATGGAVKNGKDAAGNPVGPELEKIKRLIKYSVDRFGAYADIWELLNEQHADNEWYAIMVPYLHSIDPYHKMVTTSWQKPELDGIDINAPHAYKSEPDVESDRVAVQMGESYKRSNKLVIFGEQGNSAPTTGPREARKMDVSKGAGGVWDPLSAQRMRVRLWTAYFREYSVIFWLTSYAKDGHRMNIWVGAEERQYVHALQDFCTHLDGGVKMAEVKLDGVPPKTVRSYGLRSGTNAAVYLVHSTCDECTKAGKDPVKEHDIANGTWNHDRGDVSDLSVAIDVPGAGVAYWYSPTDATILQKLDVKPGQQSLKAPKFKIDLALLITPGPAPDIDHDGIPNDKDDDNDNDGVPNAKDAWPLEREESADADHDRIADNCDADIDADGKADDLNHNGTPDNEEKDWDGDGVPNTQDAFPRDPKESKDTDGDGIGDNADKDIDGDGYTNEEEIKAGTDPTNGMSFPATN